MPSKRVQIRCPVGSETDSYVPKKLRVNEQYARETFNLFDRRRVGYFTDKDINRLFSTSKQQLKEFTDRFDENRDGKIEWDEYMTTMTQFVDEKGDLNYLERIYVTVSEPGSSVVSKWISLIIMALIIISTASFVIDTVPDFKIRERRECCCHVDTARDEYERYYEDDYDPSRLPSADWVDVADDFSPPEKCECEPQSNPIFFWTEFLCIIIFTIEYLIKICTCWASRFGSQFELILDVVTVPEEYRYPKLMRVYHFVTNPMNLIDLAAIVPFYFSEYSTWAQNRIYYQDWCAGVGGGGLGFLRVLRLMRVFRVFKMGKYSQGMQLFSKVMLHSLPALKLLCFFTLLGMVLFGSLIYFFERGTWLTMPGNHYGAYYRQDLFAKGLEMSPFTSIPSCFWWVIVTQTTVGYGDSYPTTEGGKLIGSVCMISGVLVLALPITIIGANFANEYAKVQAEEARERHQLAAAQAKFEADEARRKKKLAKQGIYVEDEKKGGMLTRILSAGRTARNTATTPSSTSERIAPEVGAESENGSIKGGWTSSDHCETIGIQASDSKSPILSVTDETDSDDDDEISDIELIKETMGNLGGELIGMIRDYIDADRVTKAGGDQMLYEINELMKMLNQKELTSIPLSSVHGMLTVAWHWLSRCEHDDTVVLLPAHKIKLLKLFWDFASSTQRCPD